MRTICPCCQDRRKTRNGNTGEIVDCPYCIGEFAIQRFKIVIDVEFAEFNRDIKQVEEYLREQLELIDSLDLI